MRPLARFSLFIAFAFTVMADPVSSVAYALEAALGALDGQLRDLLPTMVLVVVTIALVAASYHQLIGRFPGGGGGAEGMAAAFGEAWAFVPVGALLVDFTLTIAVSCAAATSAMIAYFPRLAGARVLLAIGVAVLVCAGSVLGHRGRMAFAAATLLFIGTSFTVIVLGAGAEPATGAAPLVADARLVPVLLAMPLGMALATGVEAPSNAIAQLAQLGDKGRRLFGRLTIWLMLAVVGLLTLAFSAYAVRLNVGLPPSDSTLLAEIARRCTGGGPAFAIFQASSALLLFAAAASSYLAGSGLLKALALHGGDGEGLLPPRFGQINRFLTPYWGIVALLITAIALLLVAGAREQTLVNFYAVAVFASFFGALTASARLSQREREWGALAINLAGTIMVAFVLVLNLGRIDALVSLSASALISLYLWRAWVARGCPAGVTRVVR